MAKKKRPPISPELHGAIDYGIGAANALVPGLLHMSGKARTLFRMFGLVQGGLNALTIQPLALKKLVPFELHGLIEKSSLPVYLLAPILSGVTRERRARNYWLLLGAGLVVVYNLTDWDAAAPGKKGKKRR